MRLEFEDWILSQKISETAKDLFSEAVTCYKASAYRASLLLSYLGFQAVIRDRILGARRPVGINEGLWSSITRELRDDDKWDSKVFEAIHRRSPSPIFRLSDDIRHQVAYWKNRRNDCAHSKRNAIGFSHVESFWLFIQSNLARFVVSGSKEGLLDDIRVHFDRSLTPAGGDYSFITEQIPTAVEIDELEGLFDEILQVFTELYGLPPNTYHEDEVSFLNTMLDIRDAEVTSTLVEFLSSRENLLVALLRANPSRLLYFAGDAAFVRKLWYSKLIPMSQSEFVLYCSLLRNQLVPEDQLQEAHRRVIPHLFDVTLMVEFCPVLEESGFFEAFRETVFLRSDSPPDVPLADDFSWANRNRHLVVFYLDRFGVDKDVAESLSRIFSKPNHPFELKNRINSFLSQNPEKREEFFAVFEENLIRLPEHLYLQEQGDYIPF
jgi:hypothetical protein